MDCRQPHHADLLHWCIRDLPRSSPCHLVRKIEVTHPPAFDRLIPGSYTDSPERSWVSTSQRVSLDWPRVRRCTIAVDGIVQGVGFRPSVYRLAVSYGLAGSVRNSRAGVLIDAEGENASLDAFLRALEADAPGEVSVAWDQP